MHYDAYTIEFFLRILQLFIIAECQCPEYFRYFRNESTGEIMGIVEIPSPPQSVPLTLRVVLSVATVIPTKYVGRLELAKSREDSIRTVIQGMPLYYHIYFPVRRPIPVLTSILLNNNLYCSGPPAIGVIVTNIILEHTLYPPRIVIPLTEKLLDFIANQSKPVIIPPSTSSNFMETRKTTVTLDNEVSSTTVPDYSEGEHYISNNNLIDSSCGLISGSNLLKADDETVSPFMWPWYAAIFAMKDGLEFQCSGNLISRFYILTVAHCLIEDDENIPASTLLVSLGRFDFLVWTPDSLNVDVAEYKLHPNYSNNENGDSDLALVRVMERIKYTRHIRPICLWLGKAELDYIIGKFGYVVGWGIDKQNKSLTHKPRINKVPIVSQEDCLRSNVEFIRVTSNRTFCAGKRNGKGPCSGDGGSGLVLYNTQNGRYHLRGILSLSLFDVGKKICDLHEYIVYVDIAKYISWIHKEVMT